MKCLQNVSKFINKHAKDKWLMVYISELINENRFTKIKNNLANSN